MTFLDSRLAPRFRANDEKRRKLKTELDHARKTAILFLCIGAVLILRMPLQGLFLIGMCLLWYFWRTEVRLREQYSDLSRSRVIRMVVEFIDGRLGYSEKSSLPKSVFVQSRLFSAPVNRFKGRNLVTGRLEGAEIAFSEVQAAQEAGFRLPGFFGKKKRTSVFTGHLFTADFTEPFPSITLAHSRKTPSAELPVTGKCQPFQMAEPEFDSLFAVWGDDPAETRKLLADPLQERLVHFSGNRSRPLYLSLVGSRCCLAIPALPAPDGHRLMAEMQIEWNEIREYYENIRLFTAIISDLNPRKHIRNASSEDQSQQTEKPLHSDPEISCLLAKAAHYGNRRTALGSQITERMTARMKNGFAPELSDGESPLFFSDDTFLKTGKKGILLTDRHLFGSVKMQGCAKTSIRDLSDLTVRRERGHSSLFSGENKCAEIRFAPSGLDILTVIIRELKRQGKKENPTAHDPIARIADAYPLRIPHGRVIFFPFISETIMDKIRAEFAGDCPPHEIPLVFIDNRSFLHRLPIPLMPSICGCLITNRHLYGSGFMRPVSVSDLENARIALESDPLSIRLNHEQTLRLSRLKPETVRQLARMIRDMEDAEYRKTRYAGSPFSAPRNPKKTEENRWIGGNLAEKMVHRLAESVSAVSNHETGTRPAPPRKGNSRCPLEPIKTEPAIRILLAKSVRLLRGRVEVGTEIPSASLQAAVKSYAGKMDMTEHPLLLITDTVLETARKGMMLTDRRLYARFGNGKSVMFDFTDLKQIDLQQKNGKPCLLINRKPVPAFTLYPENAVIIQRILQEIQSCHNRNQPSPIIRIQTAVDACAFDLFHAPAFFSPFIPAIRLKNARHAYAKNLPENETVLLLMDDSADGSGKAGSLVTDRRIYADSLPQSVEYALFEKIRFDSASETPVIHLNPDHAVRFRHLNGRAGKAFARMLREVSFRGEGCHIGLLT